ncbi:MAG: hypothetical protein D6788_00330 [Planctomycetota bacterium]|nr:MAG: hypothetical protein D6788_00330 [Planctomycetota bacterium]
MRYAAIVLTVLTVIVWVGRTVWVFDEFPVFAGSDWTMSMASELSWASLVATLSVWWMLVLQTLRSPKPKCVRCGYTLQGLAEPKCPECGEPVPPALWNIRA